MAVQSKIRVGLVGVGNWARYGHIPALKLFPEYEIVAVSSRSLEKAREIGKTFEIPYVYGDMQQLVEDPAVDLVVVLPPAPEHAAIVKAAILAGKDVYCEWPLTTNTQDSRELLRLAEERGVRHLVGLQRTLGASALHLRGLLSEGYVGRLRSVRMHVSMAGFGPVRSASLDWTIPASNFSHVLSIYGGHFMDMLFHATGQPAAITSLVRTQFPELTSSTGESFPNETPDGVMLMGTLKNGAMFQIQLEGGKCNQTGLQIDITGTDGDLQITNEKAFVTKHDDIIRGAQGDGGSWKELPTPHHFHTIPLSGLDASVQDLAQLYAAFASDRVNGGKTTRDFSDAVAMHKMIDMIYEASSTERTIVFKEQS
ncbi:Gfo/Idh/MocA family protein [Granulicella arctica]|uniref:Gfo/Idh/MocA family protein n=1 Tax=Granulicella arctica TaxID=940613 RepID=UPI0021E05C67|nr:Gfo/Idh/MocA family oxidoreductase [Granulicella arctica]